MKKLLFSVFLISSFLSLFSQEQRALVIGIDTYSPPEGAVISTSSERIIWPTLDGCKNDAELIKQIIISRYAFPEKNVQQLVNMEATRAGILGGIEQLLKASNKNDIAFFIVDYENHETTINMLTEDEVQQIYDEGVDLFFNLNVYGVE